MVEESQGEASFAMEEELWNCQGNELYHKGGPPPTKGKLDSDGELHFEGKNSEIFSYEDGPESAINQNDENKILASLVNFKFLFPP